MLPRAGSRLFPNTNHPLNVGRLNWWLVEPDQVWNQAVWLDLMDRTNMVRPTGTVGTVAFQFNGAARQNSVFMGGSNVCYFQNQQTSSFLYPSTAFTFAAWAKQNGTPFSTMICGERVSGGATRCRFWVQSQKVNAEISTTTSSYTATGATTTTGSTWNHFAVTWDGGTLRVFLNGVQDASTVTAGTLTPPSTKRFFIGLNSDFGDRWNGWLNDIGVWRRALSASELKQLMAASRRNYEGLLIRQPLVWRAPTSSTIYVDRYQSDPHNEVPIAARKRRQKIVYLLPGSWSILPTLTPEAITVDKFHTPLAQPPRPRTQNRPRMETVAKGSFPEQVQPDPFFLPMGDPPRIPTARQLRGFAFARGELGDVERPDATDQLSAGRPVWHTPLAEPPRRVLTLRDRAFAQARGVLGDVPRPDVETAITTELQPWYAPLAQPPRRTLRLLPKNHVYPFWNYGEPPAPEPVTVDRFLSQTRLPVWVPRRLPPLVEYTPDTSHLGDVEDVLSVAWDVTMGRVVLARRPPLWIPGSEQTLRDVWPDPPEASDMPPWHVALALPPRAKITRGPRHFYPDGGMVYVEELVIEAPEVKFHTPMAIPQLRRRPAPPERPAGRIDLEPTQLVERVFADAFHCVLPLLPNRHRRRVDLARTDLGADPTLAGEQPHPDVLGRDVFVRPHPRLPMFLATMTDGALLPESNFIAPFIAKMKKGMLAAGFWRARL